MEPLPPSEPPRAAAAPAPAPAVAQERRFPTMNVVLFLATIAATLSAGATFAIDNQWVPVPATLAEHVLAGVPFSVSLLGILVAHEMGHFVTARWHRVDASWPYFIPVPIGIGTFGAVIRMRGRIPTRNALVDIGASGPLAGAVIAVPVLLYGITLSRISEVPADPNFLFGNLSLLSLAKAVVTWSAPYTVGLGMEPQPLLYILLKKVVFQVAAHQDVIVHPVAYAGVIGLYVTALNLVPIGQLDGGHVAFAVLGKRAERLGRIFTWVMVAMLVFSSVGWIIWLLLVRRFVGLGHPPVEREEPLSPLRRAIVVATVLLLVLTLTPVSMDIL